MFLLLRDSNLEPLFIGPRKTRAAASSSHNSSCFGATTLSIMTLSVMGLLATFSISVLRTIKLIAKCRDFLCNAECRYAKCRCVEGRVALLAVVSTHACMAGRLCTRLSSFSKWA